ncbi:IS6 family transposase [Halorhabdus rudnickae]|uniref:IS6 family transposase n=1 Tax=Halorhabdus rudnickae TaxID=1775544 RepID=UPI0010829522|nr:IS6 family transposase [Halorhabdus rudnickae]
MARITRLSGSIDQIDVDFVEREATSRLLMKLSIHLHLAGLSLSNTVPELEKSGVQRSRKAIHDWVQKADLQPVGGKAPNQIVLDETVIRINDQQYWLYAAANPETNELLQIRLYSTATTALTQLFLQELREKHDVENAVFLVDGARHLQTALQRAGLRFQVERGGNRNSIERIFREVKRRTSSFSNYFRHVEPETAENWLQSFPTWWNSLN